MKLQCVYVLVHEGPLQRSEITLASVLVFPNRANAVGHIAATNMKDVVAQRLETMVDLHDGKPEHW